VEKYKSDGKTAVCNLASINLSKVYTKEDIERVVPTAIRMLDNGYLAFIATNNWVTNSGAKKLRNIVLEESQILSLVDFSSFMV
ncbi:hypothetical protein VWM83_09825, partial [Campylobacter coli]